MKKMGVDILDSPITYEDTSSVAHDYKYLALISGEPEWGASVKSTRSKTLRPLAGAFATNLMRTASLAFTPTAIAYKARRHQRIDDYALFKSTGDVTPELSFLVEDELPDELQQEVNQERIKDDQLPKKDLDGLRMDYGVTFVESLLETIPGMRVSMEALMSSVVIESWMAFETLASPLWIAAVNHGPVEFAQRVCLATQGKGDSKVPDHHKDKLRHDPRENYAGSLVEVGTVTLRRLDRIFYWYRVVLENSAKKLFLENKDIHALAAYRNVLIHNAGKVDKDFIKQIEPVADLRGKFSDNQLLQLDGALVRRLRNAAIMLGVSLIQAVDDALTPKPKTNDAASDS